MKRKPFLTDLSDNELIQIGIMLTSQELSYSI